MAKNQSSGNPNGSCEKIYKATLSTIHRIAHCPKNNVPNPVDHPTSKANVSSTKPIAFRQIPTAASVEIPIEFDPRLELLAKQRVDQKEKKDKVSGPVQKVTRFSPKVEPHQGHVPVKVIPLEDGEGGKKLTEQHTFNDKVSAYIDRVKNKMRATSNVGQGKSFSRRDSFNDRVSNYINHAKLKLKTASTIKSNED